MRRSDHLGCDWQPNGTEAGCPGPSRYFRKDTRIRWSTEGKTSKSTRLDNNGKLEILIEVRRTPKIPTSFRYGVRIRAPWLTLQLHYDMSNQRILRIPKQECTKIMEDVRGVYSAYEEKVPYVFMMTERLRRVFILDVFCSLLHIKSLRVIGHSCTTNSPSSESNTSSETQWFLLFNTVHRAIFFRS